MTDKKTITLKTPISIECNSLLGKTELIGVYKAGRSFRAFDAFGNWFTVSKLPYNVQVELSTAIFQYNNLY